MAIIPNSLFHSDCFALLERTANGTASLVYLDPPWFMDEVNESGFGSEGQANSVKKSKQEHALEVEARFQEYLEFLSKVLQQSHRVLTNHGILFFHVEPRLSGYVRLLIDEVYERNKFVTEIILPYPRHNNRQKPSPEHSTLLMYGKTEDFTYYPPKRALTPKEIQEKFNQYDEKGAFRLADLTSPVKRPNLIYDLEGVLPPSGRSWKYSKEKMEELKGQGFILINPKNNIPLLKIYLSDTDTAEVEVGNIWDDISPRVPAPERTDFGPQQNLALLTRIILMGTDEGDIIFDPFCGSGTALVAAEKLKRKWIGCDCSEEACSITLKRLDKEISYPETKNYFYLSQSDLEKKFPIIHRVYSRALNGLPQLPNPIQIFVLNKVLPIEETRHYEFKEVTSKNPVSTIKDIAEQYAVAFLNSEGGRIFWGVRDNRTVSGIVLNSSDRDEIRRVVGEKLTSIKPSIAPTAYKIEFHPVRDENNILENLYVVEMAIPRPNNTDLYFTGKDEAWVRIDGGKKRLSGPEIQQEILHKKGLV